MGIKVLILGSCVTRDVIEFDEQNTIELVEYFARSSIAGFGLRAAERNLDCSGISSGFQRRVVEYEIKKTLKNFISDNSFDILCIDLIDERFGLLSSEDRMLVMSRSNELLLTDVETVYHDLELIQPLTDEFFQLWEKGWCNLCHTLIEKKCLNRVLVSKVFWSHIDSAGDSLEHMYRKGWINKNNEFLEKLYKRMAEDLAPSQFIEFEPDEIRADKMHKWGLSPFHYNATIYRKILSYINLYHSVFDLGTETNEIVLELLNLRVDQKTQVLRVEDSLNADAEFPFLRDFHTAVATEHGIQQLMSQALTEDKLEVVSPITGDVANLRCSVFVAGRNFLIFSDSSEIFIVVQHHKFCRALFLPSKNMLIKFDDIDLPNRCVNDLSSFFNKNRQQLSSILENTAWNKCAGLFVSYGRPYHYFYDSLPVALKYKEKVSSGQKIISISGGEFFPSCELFGSELSCTFDSPESFSESLLRNGLFCVMTGYASARGNEYTQYDELIRQHSLLHLEGQFSDVHDKLSAASDVIWFGICAEKRKWKEQVSVVRKVISVVLKEKRNPVFVFDGLTSTTDSTPVSFRKEFCKEECETFAQICKSLLTPENTVCLIGEQAALKIAVASYATSFLTSFLTDSMYVARFNAIRGVAFGANKAMHSDHLHPNTIFVPQDWVQDDETGSRNWSEVSYGISENYMQALMNAVINGESATLCFSNKSSISSENLNIRSASERLIVNSELGKAHSLVALYADDIRQLQLPSNKDIVVSCRGRCDRYLNLNLILSLDGVTGATPEVYYLSVGKSIHLKAADHMRTFDVKLRVKGCGEAEIFGLDIIYLDVSDETGKQEDSVVDCTLDQLVNVLGSVKSKQMDINCWKDANVLNLRFVPQESDNLLIFFHSALTRTVKTNMPAFAGNGAIGVVDANILMISDPCITNENSISLAWYAGAESFKCQSFIKDVINCFVSVFGKDKIVLFGGSGGGFASLYYGQYFEGSISVAANPQTDISLYLESSVKHYLETCFPSLPPGTVRQQLDLAGIDYVVNAKQNNKVIYLQNKFDTHHISKHVTAYAGDALISSSRGANWLQDNVMVYFSENWGKGHTAPPRAFTFGLLQEICAPHFCFKGLPNVLLKLDEEHLSLIDRVVLAHKDEVFYAKIVLSASAIDRELLFAFYLLRNGERVEYITYQPDNEIMFKYTEQNNSLFQVVGFARDGEQKTVVKSNKIHVGN